MESSFLNIRNEFEKMHFVSSGEENSYLYSISANPSWLTTCLFRALSIYNVSIVNLEIVHCSILQPTKKYRHYYMFNLLPD